MKTRYLLQICAGTLVAAVGIESDEMTEGTGAKAAARSRFVNLATIADMALPRTVVSRHLTRGTGA